MTAGRPTVRGPDAPRECAAGDVEHPASGKLLAVIGSPLDAGELLAFRRRDAVHPLDGESGGNL